MARVSEIRKALEGISSEVGSETVEDFLSGMDRDYFTLYSPEEIRNHLRMASRLDPQHRGVVQILPRKNRFFEITLVAFDAFSEFAVFCGLLASFGLDIQAGQVHTWRSRRSRAKIIDVFRVRAAKGKGFDAQAQREFEGELAFLLERLDRGLFAEARRRIHRRLIDCKGLASPPPTGEAGLEPPPQRFASLAGFLRPLAPGPRPPFFRASPSRSRGSPGSERPIERRSHEGGRRPASPAPMRVRFDNRRSSRWTRLEIQGRDTPGFLYAAAFALAMRGVYIHKVQIQNVGSEVRDALYISDRRGRKFLDEKERRALKIAAILIKQFISFLDRAPDPAQAVDAFDSFLDRILAAPASRSFLSFLKKEETLTMLARLFGASEFLWEDFLRTELENLLPILERFQEKRLRSGKGGTLRRLRRGLAQAASFEEKKGALNRFKDRELFRIDLWRLLHPSGTLIPFSRALTDLAEGVVDQAYRICDAHLAERHGAPLQKDGAPSPFSICALGKFGGRELGYASDLELLFVYGGAGETRGPEGIENQAYFEKLSQAILQTIASKPEGIFQIDTRLRPDGSAGPLATSLERFGAYYAPGGGAAPFERQALIKLRAVGGDRALGREIEARRDRFVYGGAPWDLPAALALRERQKRELVPEGKINVKYSAGGLLDVEYAVQYLQILHGPRHPGLRTPSTLEALSRLSRLGILIRERGRRLREAYLFLRAVIDALRIVRGRSKDLILPDPASEPFIFLARRMGYGRRNWEAGGRLFSREIARQMAGARRIFEVLFGAPDRAPERIGRPQNEGESFELMTHETI